MLFNMCPMQNSTKYCTNLLAVFEVKIKNSANDRLEIGIYHYSTYIPTKMQTV